MSIIQNNHSHDHEHDHDCSHDHGHSYGHDHDHADAQCREHDGEHRRDEAHCCDDEHCHEDEQRHEEHGCSCCSTGPTYFNAKAEQENDGFGVPVAAVIGAALFAAGVICEFFGKYFLPQSVYGSFDDLRTVPGVIFACVFLAAYVLIGHGIVKHAALGIIRGDLFNENTLMSVASIGSFIIGEYPEAVAVMLFYRVGEYLQDRAVDRSKSRIRNLLDIRPDTANLLTADGVKEVRAEDVMPDDRILVKPGERAPLDGIIAEGQGYIDMSALTGESAPVSVAAGDEILAGSVSTDGLLNVRVTKVFGESTASRIIGLVESAEAGKAKTENFITRFAKVYTPIVVGLALLLAVVPPLFGLGSFMEWIRKGLVFLVVSCPCALVVSIPVGFFGGIGAASVRGILIKGGNYLEALATADTAVFDKTGTLTTGTFRVTEVRTGAGFGEESVLRYAAALERNSTHPIARSIVGKYEESGASAAESGMPAEVTEKAGLGVSALLDGKRIFVGNKKLLNEEKVRLPKDVQSEQTDGVVIYVAVDGEYAGEILLSDTVKPDSRHAIDELRAIGVRRTVMLTGDRAEAAEAVRAETGLTEAISGLMPWQKVEAMESIMAADNAGSVIYMGDGINDAPVLAQADVGIAMGALGSDAAIEAADIVIMNDAPSKLVSAIKIARKTMTIVRENIVLSLGLKVVVLALAALGFVNMWVAVFADVGVALLAVANALRAGRAVK
ncbi:MAG: cadmium-translocating P-type ATPase [Clostridiales Family XIII bacterium]|jgi:Cd2+/Zn2+-exporting ATPase|nr:cadmium-translocating P-type ATPase [Clostridiales Family XIII bacterium]